MKKRKITVITGTRAEYGILKSLLKKIKHNPDLELDLIATGMHLLEEYGLTVKEIERDGFKISKKIKMYPKKAKDLSYHGKSLAKGVENFTDLFLKDKPEILVLFGDRLEPLAACLAGATLKIPMIHIHAGDKTDSGHIDEGVRNTITRFSHIHFAPTEKCKTRLIKMGEQKFRVYNTGGLSIDSMLETPKIKKQELFKKLNLNPKEKLIICLFHPVILEIDKIGGQMREIIKALKQIKIQTLIIYPNNDAGSQDIIKEIKKAEKLSFIKTLPSVSYQDYINLLRQGDLLIGNSSSGVIETSTFKLPVVSVGSRNLGREHGANVIFTDSKKEKILKAIKKALYDKDFRKIVNNSKNPWGDGKAVDRIIKVLTNFKLDKKLLQKKITY